MVKNMAQALLEEHFELADGCDNALVLVEKIKNYIEENECPKLSMDVTHLNMIDASKVTIICSTYHWAKYPEGEISWLINAPEIKELVKPLNLGNIRLITAQ